MQRMKHFRYWCYKVLPLVYDDSLSYYEVLCKVVEYINRMVDNQREFGDDLGELKSELEEVQEWIRNFDTTFIKDIVDDYIATMIFVEISDAGYIMYYIPETWDDITFNTTELDIHIPEYEEYGRLVLSY